MAYHREFTDGRAPENGASGGKEMPAEFKRLFEVLEDVTQSNPGIRLYEIEPMPEILLDDPSQKEAFHRRGIWDAEHLLKTVERDFRNMTPGMRQEFEAIKYWWGYLEDGRIAIGAIHPGRGSFLEYIEMR